MKELTKRARIRKLKRQLAVSRPDVIIKSLESRVQREKQSGFWNWIRSWFTKTSAEKALKIGKTVFHK